MKNSNFRRQFPVFEPIQWLTICNVKVLILIEGLIFDINNLGFRNFWKKSKHFQKLLFWKKNIHNGIWFLLPLLAYVLAFGEEGKNMLFFLDRAIEFFEKTSKFIFFLEKITERVILQKITEIDYSKKRYKVRFYKNNLIDHITKYLITWRSYYKLLSSKGTFFIT